MEFTGHGIRHLHSEQSLPNSLQIERNLIVVTVFLLILNATEYRWVQSHKEMLNVPSLDASRNGGKIWVSYFEPYIYFFIDRFELSSHYISY